MRSIMATVLVAILAPVSLLAVTAEASDAADEADAIPPTLDFEMERLDGEPVHLSTYHGDVVLIVNTASKCGLTPQYEQLQQLHESYHDRGLSILGFPANNFGKQEPGTDEQIAQFCQRNYGVTFDMFSKVSVAGEDQCPLYAHLTGEETNPGFAGPIAWNFEKFLIGRDGTVVARFAPKVTPDSDEVVEAIEAALAQPSPAADAEKQRQ